MVKTVLRYARYSVSAVTCAVFGAILQ